MKCYGVLSFEKKDGSSTHFDLLQRRYLFGSSVYCDFRFNLNTVSAEHAWLCVEESGQVWVNAVDGALKTIVSDEYVQGKVQLKDKDVLEIGGRKFTFHGKINHVVAAPNPRLVYWVHWY